MKEMYTRILQLLGKKPDDQLFSEFVADLEDRPIAFLDNEVSTEYQFANSGFEISFMKGPNCFTYAFIFFRSPKSDTAKTRWQGYYAGELPHGVDALDTPSELRSKLGIPEPDISTDEDICFETPPFKLRWHFRKFDNKLSILALVYMPGNDWITVNGTKGHLRPEKVPPLS